MFRFYADPALTTTLSSLALTTLLDGGSASPVSAVVYFGKPTAGRQITPASGSQITITPVDATSASGLSASAVKLALSESGLATATGGAALNIGATRSSGAANALAVWVSISPGAVAVGNYTDLSLVTNDVVEADLV